MIKKNELVEYENKGDFRGMVLEDVLKRLAEKARIELIKIKTRKGKQNKLPNKTAITSTIDVESNKIINILIKDKTSELKEISPIKKINNKIIIKPLYLFLDEEVLLYAKLKGLKFTKPKVIHDK